jgi:hypothetical protein
MEKLRHKWSGQVEGSLSFAKGGIVEQQQCLKCKIYRHKALNMWHYSKEKVTNENMLVDFYHNTGCIN